MLRHVFIKSDNTGPIMWHEARRQERKIRGMLVDYRKRAERRRDFYERIKADPTQFLQIHGRQCKIHLDPMIAAAADSAVMMPWQGNENNLIDRFDVRAHLDYIPPVKKDEDSETTQEERYLNYERYRIIAQNSYLSISEEKFLKQLHLEEQFGYTETKTKKESKGTGAAIGFNYEEGTAISAPPPPESPEDNYEDDNSDSDLDVDLAINVSKIDPTQAHEMNKHGQHFGMAGNDFYSFLTNDLEEAESFKLAKEEEHEKALYSGRKSRRERRAHREKRLANRKISPPSYAAKESPNNPTLRDESKSPSRSPSPSPDAGKITYITSFGDDEDTPSSSKPTYADKVKYGKPKKTVHTNLVHFDKQSRSNSRDRKPSSGRKSSRSTSRSRRSRSRSRSKRNRNTQSRSRSPHSKKRRSKSRSRSSSRSRFRSYRIEKSSRSSSRSHRIEKRSRSRSRSHRIEKSSRSRSRSHRTEKNSRSRSLSVKARKGRSRSRSRRTKSSSRSRSVSRKSRSRSRQRSLRRSVSSSPLSSSSSSSISSSTGKSRSKSPISKSMSKSPVAPAPPIIRYYGRKKSDMSSSVSDSSEEDGDYGNKSEHAGSSDSNHRYGNNSGTGTKKSSSLTVIERLRLKRQALINRQFKKDKIAEVQKIMREKQAQQTREDELREMAIKLRRRQRELRHANDRTSSSDSGKSTTSKKKEASVSPSRNRDRGESTRSDKEREKDNKRDRERRRSSSRDKNRHERSSRHNRSRSTDRSRRSRSRSKKRYDRDRRRSRTPETRESAARKLVDY